MRCYEKMNMLHWGRGVPINDMQFLVRDGVGQRIVEPINYDSNFLYLNDLTQIPYHRVLTIMVKGEIVWEKR